MSLLNKVAIVTGASSGIGAAVAAKFTEAGARVVIVGRNEDKLRTVSETCDKLGSKPLIIAADVTYDEDVKRIISDTLNFFGKLDILVNNAGIWTAGSILDNNAMEIYDKAMSTNLRSCVLLTHLAAKHLIQTKGNIVNVSSYAGSNVISRTAFSYGTSKAGLDHLTRCIALELSQKGVRVNAIQPGPVKTELFDKTKVTTDRFWEVIKKTTALERVSGAEEIADLIEFLASDKARSITGSIYCIDNGASMLGPVDSAAAVARQ